VKNIKVSPVAGALGAEVSGVNLCAETSPETYAEIHAALVEFEVLFFRGQPVSSEQQRRLARHFGPLQQHPAYGTVEGFPEISILESTAENPTKIECWHSDMTFRAHPPMGTVLRSRIIPDRGGDTMWSSMTSAYNALSEPMQSFLSGLNAMHDFAFGFKESLAEPGGRERLAQALADYPPVQHPVIRIHPESGRKVLFVNELFTTHIVGLSKAESSAVLSFLYEHIKTPEFTCRFTWQPDNLVIWDNRSTQHKPVNDYFPAHRLLERITIDGDVPY
jgi:taurine dioxygenase